MALGPRHHVGARGVIVLHVEQARGRGADAGHALRLRQGGELFGVFDGQAGDWTTR